MAGKRWKMEGWSGSSTVVVSVETLRLIDSMISLVDERSRSSLALMIASTKAMLGPYFFLNGQYCHNRAVSAIEQMKDESE